MSIKTLLNKPNLQSEGISSTKCYHPRVIRLRWVKLKHGYDWWLSELDCMSVLLSLLCTNQGCGIVIRVLKGLAWLDFTFSFKHTDSQSTWYSLSVAGDMVGNAQNLHFSLNQHLLPYSHLVYMPSWLRISACPILSPAIGVWKKEDGPNPTGHKCIECAFVSPSLPPLSCYLFVSFSLPLSVISALWKLLPHSAETKMYYGIL